jgi:ADP-heptose:LPS heptosyltransferase
MAKPRLQKILISRTDAIGDVCLTLPVCVALKQQFPEAELVYLCRNYTAPVVACFEPIDDTLIYEELEALSNDERALKLEGFSAVLHLFPNKIVANWCKQARIPLRVGTAHRLHHWWTCNLLPWFSRKRSDLHEAQLNFYLAKAIGYPNIPNWIEIKQTNAFRVEDSLPAEFHSHDFSKVILLHPKSNGSGVELPFEKYAELSLLLVEKGFEVFFTGTEKEGELFRNQIPKNSKIKDVTGLWDLKTFIAIISKSKALIACSTGPYHLAGLCQIQAIGLFTNTRPIHPGRWAALGTQSKALTEIETISPQQIADALQ